MADVAYKQGLTANLFSVVNGSFIGVLGLEDQEQYLPTFVNGTGIGMVTPAGNQTGVTTVVAASRDLTAADNGNILELAENVALTVPVGLPVGFRCKAIPNGANTVVSDGTALLNGATTTVTRTSASNYLFEIVGRVSAVDSYVVSGVAPV